MLINPFGNALRYTPPGGTVRVSAEQQDGAVAFHVADSGIGIAPEHLAHLFERFYRVDKARSRALGRSGIGLTIAKALVEAHDGHIWATSTGLDQGATFSFTLPIASQESRSPSRPPYDPASPASPGARFLDQTLMIARIRS